MPAHEDMLAELSRIEQKDRFAIGWVYHEHELNVIVLGGRPKMQKYAITTDERQKTVVSHEEPAKVIDGTEALRSPDGRWITYRSRGNKFVLANANGQVQRTLLDGQRVLTPLRWSPDSNYLLYVQKGGIWDTAALRCGDDVFYVMVCRVSDGLTSSVLQLCQGYPYWELQWIQLPTKVPF
jgi:hypothetical protein